LVTPSFLESVNTRIASALDRMAFIGFSSFDRSVQTD
jgi:hypothetical protein